MPSFYHHPQTIDDLVTQFCCRVMAHLGLEQPQQFRWTASRPAKGAPGPKHLDRAGLVVALSLAGLADALYFTFAYYGRVKKARWVPEALCAKQGSSCLAVVRRPTRASLACRIPCRASFIMLF